MTPTHHDTDTSREPVRINKILPPLARQLAETMAVEVGACIRPLAVKRLDSVTGRAQVVPLPCGATRSAKCPSCAERARRLRIWQAREGWHLTEEPTITTAEPTGEQMVLIRYRAELEDSRAVAAAAGLTHQVAELDAAISDADAMLRGAGVRGSLSRHHQDEEEERPARRVRSTRRRQDAPNLPRHRVTARTTGRTFAAKDGQTYQPSTFLTLTLPSYGPVRADGSPVDPDGYDYRRAARDAIHFGLLIDRFWQNLRRAAGWNCQYFACVEPQKRGAPHLHAAVRGTLPRKLIRQVAAATYHQVWWPPHDQRHYRLDRLPLWDETRPRPCYVDRETGEPLPTWDQALDGIDPDGEPAHVVRLGRQVDIQGVLGGSRQAGECLGYLVKYLTKSLDECHEPETAGAADHVDRFTEALRYEPCSERCANWLLYGVQPAGACAGLMPGLCKGKAHRPENLGYAGRRCLVSRKWSGRTLTEHRGERRDHVLRVLGAVGAKPEQTTPEGDPGRYSWQLLRPGDPDQPDRLQLLMQGIAQRQRWRQQYEHARDQAPPEHPATDDHAA